METEENQEEPRGEEEYDPFANMTELEAEQLAKAEFRYKSLPVEDHRFSEFPFLHQEWIIGTYFSGYENDGSRPAGEDLDNVPLLIHSEKNRFARLCDLAMRNWIPELPELLDTMLALEEFLAAGEEPDEDLVWRGREYGIEATIESYIVGYPGATANIIARKDLISKFLRFAARSLARLPGLPRTRGPGYDMEDVMARVERLDEMILAGEDNLKESTSP